MLLEESKCSTWKYILLTILRNSNLKKHLIVITGATASGKTSLAIQLANHFQTEILSADSRQFFKEMNIGTAKPTLEELKQAKHHFIDTLSIHDEYNVGEYERDAGVLLKELFQKHDTVIMAGGSGLYIKAVCEGLDHFPKVDDKFRTELRQLVEEKESRFCKKNSKNLTQFIIMKLTFKILKESFEP